MGAAPVETPAVRLAGPATLALVACSQPHEFASLSQAPSGRLRTGVVECGGAPCPLDAGACFTTSDGRRLCAGPHASPCDAFECDAPSTCQCLLSLPPQCGCGVTAREP